MKRLLVMTTAALLLVGTVAMAQPGDGANCQAHKGMGKGMKMGAGMGMRGQGRMMHGDGDGLGRIMMMAEELELTDQQQDKLESMRSAYAIERIDRQAELKKAQFRLAELMRQDQAPEADVMGAIDDVTRLRADMQKMQYQHRQAVRSILTDKQKETLKSMRTERMHRFWDDDDEGPEAPEPPRAPRGPRGRGSN